MLLKVIWLNAHVLLEPLEVLRFKHEALQASSVFKCQYRWGNLAGACQLQEVYSCVSSEAGDWLVPYQF